MLWYDRFRTAAALRRNRFPADPDCGHVLVVLQSYLDGEVGTDVADAVGRHLELCRACGLEEEAHLAVKTALAAGGLAPLDEAVLARLRAFAESIPHTDGPS